MNSTSPDPTKSSDGVKTQVLVCICLSSRFLNCANTMAPPERVQMLLGEKARGSWPQALPSLPAPFPSGPRSQRWELAGRPAPQKAAVDSDAEPSRQMVLARLRISLRWQVLGSAIPGTTSLGSLSSLHVLRRLETSFFPREGRGWSLELPCLHRAVKVSCGRLPGSHWVGCLPVGTRAWAAPVALVWGPGGHLGAGRGGWGWAVLQLQGKNVFNF